MSTLVSDVFYKVRTVLNDYDKVRWPDAELLSWASEIQASLVEKYPDANTIVSSVALVAGAKQSAPEDTIASLDVRRNTDGRVITPCSRAALDSFSPGWVTSAPSGSIRHWMPDESSSKFWVYPPATSGATVDVVRSAAPQPLTLLGVIGISDKYADNLVNGILYRALSREGTAESAQKAVAFYQLAFA
jgi:hypothetical protein